MEGRAISTLNSITPEKLFRLIGTPGAPALIDVRGGRVETLLPSAVPRAPSDIAAWAVNYRGRNVVVVDEQGGSDSHGIAAWLRAEGANAEVLEGGVVAWRSAFLPLVFTARIPVRDAEGRTLWVTRARPKVDRIACPWLIRRFIDPEARFLFVAPPEVLAVAERLHGEPFDVEGDGVFWSHRGDLCTFDVMLEGFGLGRMEALAHLANIVRGADTGRPDIIPEAAGLLAVSLGLSRMYADDLDQLEAGMLLYDAFYRWCRDARDEQHNWNSHRPPKAKVQA